MRITLEITIHHDKYGQGRVEREIELLVPDDTTDIFGLVKVGELVEEHLANAIEEYSHLPPAASVDDDELSLLDVLPTLATAEAPGAQ